MFGRKKEEQIFTVTPALRRQLSNVHMHNYFFENKPGIGRTIDEAVQQLWDERAEVKAELEAVHAFWRKINCGECCHSEVCKKTLKFGEECEDACWCVDEETEPDDE